MVDVTMNYIAQVAQVVYETMGMASTTHQTQTWQLGLCLGN